MTQPLNDRVPIINGDGTPTQFFLRQLQERGITVDGKITAEEAEALIAEWAAERDINVTAPIIGGGSLDADVTIGLDNSGVTPGSYTNTDLTVDAFGRITAASNGSGGSGGGLLAAEVGFVNMVTTSQAAATVGNIFTPSSNVTVSALEFFITPVSGGVYRGVIAAINGSNQITAVNFTTADFTATNTSLQSARVVFGSPVVMTAGTAYYIAINRSNGTATNAVIVGAGDNTPRSYIMPGVTSANFVTLAQITPAIGHTLTLTGSNFRYSIRCLYTL